MADDIEAFLRRAAQRRAAANAEGARSAPTPTPPQRPSPPEYTNSRSERVRQPLPEPVYEAEIIEEISPAQLVVYQADERMIDHVHKSLDHQVGQLDEAAMVVRQEAANSVGMDALLKLLQQPGGLRSAILLREVFDRPTHRW